MTLCDKGGEGMCNITRSWDEDEVYLFTCLELSFLNKNCLAFKNSLRICNVNLF